jgi:hypothetical protein
MDLAKLKAYLNSRKEMESGSLFGMPLPEGTPTAEEIEQMPEDLKKLVIDTQLERAGMYTPAAKSNFSEDLNSKARNEVRMADEIHAEETGEPRPHPYMPAWPNVTEEPSEDSLDVAKFSKLKKLLGK